MARLREDARFKAVGPDTLVVDVTVDEGAVPGQVGESATDGEGEIWMDWAFVEFWKETYCALWFNDRLATKLIIVSLGSDTIQKSITNDPNAAVAGSGDLRSLSHVV